MPPQGLFGCWPTLLKSCSGAGSGQRRLQSVLLPDYRAPIYSNLKFDINVGTLQITKSMVCVVFCFVGNALTIIGCVGLLLGAAGVFDMDIFSIGLSSGVRIIGTVAIAGCLLSAIGYGLDDYAKNK